MRALIADDEPHYLEWIEDFLAKKGIEVVYATTVREAIEALTETSFRFLLIDLNIPLDDAYAGEAKAEEEWFIRYPGLYAAYVARNSGYRSRQVIIYSVHLEDTVRTYLDKIRATHIPKGWPQDLKAEIERVLEYDPAVDPED